MTCLVLNADGQPLKLMPLSIISWQDAIKAVVERKANVISEYEDWYVRSPSVKYNVPAIIMHKVYVKPETRVKFSRYNVYLRDEFHCQYCGGKFDRYELTLDHVVPRYHGGKTTWSNVVACCSKCNREKAHFLDMRPLTKPRRPDYYEMLNKRKKMPVVSFHPSWNDYLDWDQTLVENRWDQAKSLHFAA